MKSCQILFDENEQYITPSEIVEFIYCSRFTYFMNNLGIKQHAEKRYKVKAGLEKHTDKKLQSVDNVRKKIHGISKEQEKFLISKKYKLKGMIDEIYHLKDGSYAPLDYKFAEYKDIDYTTHKIQMGLYCLMIEDVYNVKVNKFFLVYLRSNNLLKEIEFDYTLRERCIKAMTDYRQVLLGYFPEGDNNENKCIDCCYKNICEK